MNAKHIAAFAKHLKTRGGIMLANVSKHIT